MEHEATDQTKADRLGTHLNQPPGNRSFAQLAQNVHIVSISSLRPADSPRLDGVDEEHIRRLAETETTLPPILVHRATMRVIDGMHRLRAALLTGRKEIQVEFFEGGEDAAFIRAVKENIVHGLPLTLADRRAAAARIVEAHPELSDRAIGAYTGLANKTVRVIRDRSTGENPQLSTRVGADGRVRPLNSQEGRRRAAEVITERPTASLREVAATAGISVGTAHDVRQRMRRGEDPVRSLRSIDRSREGHVTPLPNLGSASSSQSDESAGRPKGRAAEVDHEAILRSLARDPAMKQTEAGRALLRWLHTPLIWTRDWSSVVSAVPAYRIKSVAALARECGEAWHRFAHELECREHFND